jgi:hypothetical protein
MEIHSEFATFYVLWTPTLGGTLHQRAKVYCQIRRLSSRGNLDPIGLPYRHVKRKDI